MSIHKLTAGSGYDYLTRQVAAMDATDKGHVGLASYYTERGETPGQWIGSGMKGIDGLAAGDVVTAAQMQALFGSGHHPLAHERREHLQGPDLSAQDYRTITRLGVPYKVYSPDVSAFRLEVAQRIADLNEAAGVPADQGVDPDTRARVRTEVAREFFVAEHQREPEGARELSAQIAKHSRPRTTAVAGYDLCFSPVKSVSTLWAVADQGTAARIELAHQGAVKDALALLEERALFTRTGTNGVRQVDVQGLVATAFTHRDSRAGDPDLHTHVAIANKVQTLDGKWLSIDGRVLYKATVAASETYNTALERHLGDDLGLRFAERAGSDARKRPVREVVGVDPALNQRWSARRASIEVRRSELAANFQRTHGRPPTPVESLRLAQQATLETRQAKHELRTLVEQRTAWRAQATQELGGPKHLEKMLRTVLAPTGQASEVADSQWFHRTSEQVLQAMQERRSTWQEWHVRAEALRRVRGTDLPTDQVERAVNLLVEEVLQRKSVSLARSQDQVSEPAPLLRRDGSSVYTVAGADLFTSTKVLEAEQRLVAAAGRTDGHAVDLRCVELALLESTANGVSLNAGQAALVRQMATSRARVQLAIAPAGSGKTTAMRALSAAWAEGGGTIIGLAPSAAAAAALREQVDAQTDTLAKLTWSLLHGSAPDWMKKIGPSTLVLIDEAGMADTLSLDAAVQYILERGGSVRLIGDDQQLSAIGAGGVLRDIKTSHGALHLSELLRFADPGEGAASLALRQGHTDALGFYLDHDRVHVGDMATMTEDVFGAWRSDRAGGLDSIMLAPTRELVSELNQRARAHRLAGSKAAAAKTVVLADGNQASVGELVISRSNDRKLRTSATDWVKNGDRWTVQEIRGNGGLLVQNTQTGRTVHLPADYVRDFVELGYATTVHTAQGVTADTMHGLANGQESRQQLYTMMTRGRLGNHLYLEVVGDGDPHSVIHPDTIRPLTPTDLLEAMLARDEAPVSASTQIRDLADSRTRLAEATQRYRDALYFAAQDVAGREAVCALDAGADRIVAGLSGEPAWPALRAHLMLLGAAGVDPLSALGAAAGGPDMDSAADSAAVLDWRLDSSGLRNAGAGPLPWVPGVPHLLAEHPQWGPYLTQRSQRVSDLAEQVHQRAMAADVPPQWAQQRPDRPGDDVVAEVERWRAAMQVPPTDSRPTGAAQLQKADSTWQRRLDRALSGDRAPALQEWGDLLIQLVPSASEDVFTPVLAARLAAISRSGINARSLLNTAINDGTLPDDHAASALWWRISRHLTPAVAHEIDRGHTLTTAWAPRLPDLVGAERSEQIQSSPWWPTLVATIDHGLQRGWQVEALLGADQPPVPGDDQCQAMVWRASALMDPVPHYEPVDDPSDHLPPEDLWEGVEPPADAPSADEPLDPDQYDLDPPADEVPAHEPSVEAALAVAAMYRGLMGAPDQADAQAQRWLQRELAWHESSVPRARMLKVNDLTLAYFEDQFGNSWGRRYLAQRFGQDLHADTRFRAGHAPTGWTGLVAHLRSRGVSDEEMIATGVATTARTGRLIDRFRDRVVFPVVHQGEVLGFVGRRHPDLTEEDNRGPKYLNTADTPLFRKGAQLFVAGEEHLRDGGVPVRVEGPMDAVAVTLASDGKYVGVAPLGTALTDEQATQLAGMGQDPLIATDGDLAGQVAAERDFWLLTPHGFDPQHVTFPDGSDPAALLASRGATALNQTLLSARPLGEVLVEERLHNLPAAEAQLEAARVIAARPPTVWDSATEQVAQRLRTSIHRVRQELHSAVKDWNRDPNRAAQKPLQQVAQVRVRMCAAAALPPDQRWKHVADALDPRLAQQRDWTALAELMQEAHDHGHDVAGAGRDLVAEAPLGQLPSQDLRYRLVARLNLEIASPPPVPTAGARAFGAKLGRRQVVRPDRPDSGPRR